ncbi:IclR family transcriptional regulator [Oceanospirillum linum]|nr:helix-turn-helix domain-containing protein [Oceanospirillum linum]SEF40223.1 DNA-binding transcriptional regulator, IclR family [Oleiphilus messinensis]SMP00439.1 transcriptional regulator, IclR family [Oceanospirillum linum]
MTAADYARPVRCGGELPSSGIQTLDRSMLLVELVASAGENGMTAAELEASSGFSIAAVYRMTQALRTLGLLRQVRNRGPFLLGHQLIVWGNAAAQGHYIKRAAREALRELVECFDDSFFLFVPDGYQVLCLDIQDGSDPCRSYATGIGSRIRHGVGQASLAILSHLPPGEYEQILSRNLTALQRNQGISWPEIEQAVAMCRRLGITGGVEGRAPPEFTGVASPVLDPSGQSVAAISCSLRRSKMNDSHYRALCDGLWHQTARIQQRLYGDPEE